MPVMMAPDCAAGLPASTAAGAQAAAPAPDAAVPVAPPLRAPEAAPGEEAPTAAAVAHGATPADRHYLCPSCQQPFEPPTPAGGWQQPGGTVQCPSCRTLCSCAPPQRPARRTLSDKARAGPPAPAPGGGAAQPAALPALQPEELVTCHACRRFFRINSGFRLGGARPGTAGTWSGQCPWCAASCTLSSLLAQTPLPMGVPHARAQPEMIWVACPSCMHQFRGPPGPHSCPACGFFQTIPSRARRTLSDTSQQHKAAKQADSAPEQPVSGSSGSTDGTEQQSLTRFATLMQPDSQTTPARTPAEVPLMHVSSALTLTTTQSSQQGTISELHATARSRNSPEQSKCAAAQDPRADSVHIPRADSVQILRADAKGGLPATSSNTEVQPATSGADRLNCMPRTAGPVISRVDDVPDALRWAISACQAAVSMSEEQGAALAAATAAGAASAAQLHEARVELQAAKEEAAASAELAQTLCARVSELSDSALAHRAAELERELGSRAELPRAGALGTERAVDAAERGVHSYLEALRQRRRELRSCRACPGAPQPAVVLLLPCKHRALCQRCAQQAGECPVCKARIDDRIDISEDT